MPTADEYSARVASEVNRFADLTVVHNLPAIFHYWSDTYIRPKLRALGFDTTNELFTHPLRNLCSNHSNSRLRFLSIGAGNCDFEIDVAKTLTDGGCSNFTIDCLDLNAAMLQRGAEAAEEARLSPHIAPLQGDFNSWKPEREYDAVLANQALHHVLNLEGLFSQIKASLKPHSCIVVSDMIGRNGHERWPEALDAVRHFWRRLPPSHRYNWPLRRYEDTFQDWNCCGDSFEGIRAQDILPLLLEHFHFTKFAAFGNVIDPFVDRGFGPNFRPYREFDRTFVDEVHAFDERGFRSGALTPTHLFAVLTKTAEAPTLYVDGLSPEQALRREPLSPLEFPSTPPPQLSEAEIQLSHILLAMESERKRLESQVIAMDAESRELKDDLRARTEWALTLDQQFNERTAWALALDKELAESNAWAQSLDKENKELMQHIAQQPFGQLSLKARLKRLLQKSPNDR